MRGAKYCFSAGGYGLLKSSELADIVVLPLAGEADFIGSLGQAFSFVYAFYTCVAAGFVVAYGIVGLQLLGIGELAMEGLFFPDAFFEVTSAASPVALRELAGGGQSVFSAVAAAEKHEFIWRCLNDFLDHQVMEAFADDGFLVTEQAVFAFAAGGVFTTEQE